MHDKDVIISTLLQRIEELQLLNKQLADEILNLKERIARLEKNSSTSSKPPSSDITNPPLPKGKTKKRKHGGQRGYAKHIRQPFAVDEIDEIVTHKLSDEEVIRLGLIELPQAEMALQQVSLPDKLDYCLYTIF